MTWMPGQYQGMKETPPQQRNSRRKDSGEIPFRRK